MTCPASSSSLSPLVQEVCADRIFLISFLGRQSMKKNTLRIIACAVAGIGSLVAQRTLTAATYLWDVTKASSLQWNVNNNWGGSGFPSAAGDIANVNGTFTAPATPPYRIYTSSGTPTVGILNWGSTGNTTTVQIGGYSGGGTVTFDNSGSGAQINHTTTGTAASDTFASNIVLNDNLTLTAGTTNGAFRITGSITETGGARSVTKSGTGYVTIQNSGAGGAGFGNNWTGGTFLTGGRLMVSGWDDGGTPNTHYSAIPGNITISGNGRLQNTGPEAIADTANISFTGSGVWNLGDPATSYETIGSLTSAAGISSDIYSGSVTLAAANGTTSYAGTFGSNNSVALSKTGGSTQTLAGTAANVFTGGLLMTPAVSVTGGILQLNKTAGTDALSGPIALGGTGRIRLLASNQINDASTFTFNGGTLDTNGFSETLSTLANSGASTIDMGAGASILTFANSSGQTWSGSIQILNWSGLTAGGGTDQLLFGAGGLSTGQLAMVSFVNPTNYAPGTYGATILPSGEVVAAVPEPAVLGTLAASGLLALRRRRVRA